MIIDSLSLARQIEAIKAELSTLRVREIPIGGGGGGETNTASNVGTAGVGVFKDKSGVDLRFKKINAGSSKVTVTDDTGNDEVDIDVAEANFTTFLKLASNLSDVSNAVTAFSNIKQAASETATGVVELANQTEVNAGTDTGRVITPATLRGVDDFYIAGDEAGLKQRTVDIFQTSITDHFDGSALDAAWSWASYSGFVTPTNINLTTYPSFLLTYLGSGQTVPSRAFAYQAFSSGSARARCVMTAAARAGVRIDAGDNNNYFEFFLEHNTTSIEMDLRYRYANGGVVTGPTTVWTGPAQLCVLRLALSGSNILPFYAVNAPRELNINTVAITWTPSRAGVYLEQLTGAANSADRSALFDWYKQG